MKVIKVYYRHEDDGAWIGTAPDAPGFVGHGNSFEESCRQVSEGLPDFLDEDGLVIAHVKKPGASATGSVEVSFSQTPTPVSARRVAFHGSFTGA